MHITQAARLAGDITVIDDALAPGLNSISLVTVIDNSIPIGGKIHLLAGVFNDSITADRILTYDNYLSNIVQSLTVEPITLNAPDINPLTGRAYQTLHDTMMTTIDSLGLNLLESDSLYIKQILEMSPTITPVQMNTTDFIDITIKVEASYRVSTADEESDPVGGGE